MLALIPSLNDSDSTLLGEQMAGLARLLSACREVETFAGTGWLPDTFFDDLARLNALYDTYIEHNIAASRLRIQCKAACTRCCRQMVHGVYSFEIVSLYRQLHARADYPGIHDGFLARANEFQSLLETAKANSAAFPGEPALHRALRAFAAKDLYCPLLIDSRCSVYAHRPVACRMYYSLTDPILCVTPLGKTFHLELPEPALSILAELSDRLAFPYSEFLAQGLVAFAALRQFRPWGDGVPIPAIDEKVD